MIDAMCKYDRLTIDEETMLAEGANAGNAECAGKLTLHTMRLIVIWASKWCGNGVPFEDLVSEATLATMKCAYRYRPMGSRFASYAAFYIAEAIKMALSNQVDAVSFKGADGVIAVPACGLDAPSEAVYGKSVAECLESTYTDTEEMMSQLEMEEVVAAAMDRLPPHMKDVVERRWLGMGEGAKLRDIGKEMNCSHENVRKIQKKAFAKMKRSHGRVIEEILKNR